MNDTRYDVECLVCEQRLATVLLSDGTPVCRTCDRECMLDNPVQAPAPALPVDEDLENLLARSIELEQRKQRFNWRRG